MSGPGQHQDEASPDADVRAAIVEHARRYADLGMTREVDELADMPSLSEPLATAPLIVDTDIGGDPDDTFALVAAAGLPELALVVTSDEYEGRRARLARHLLDLLDRSDVPVVAGRPLGNVRYWSAGQLTPETVPAQDDDVIATIADVVSRAAGPVRWLGIGPWSNLADLLRTLPEARDRLAVTMMGGGLNYRHADRAEHNVRLDIAAARQVLTAGLRPRIVPSDVTFTPANEITADSAEYHLISVAAGRHEWAAVIRAQVDQWFRDFHPGTMQHDAMALSLAMQLPYVGVGLTGVDLDGVGRMTPGRYDVFLGHTADYSAFRTWLTERLRAACTS